MKNIESLWMEVTMANVIQNADSDAPSSDVLLVLETLLQMDALFMIYNRVFAKPKTI